MGRAIIDRGGACSVRTLRRGYLRSHRRHLVAKPILPSQIALPVPGGYPPCQLGAQCTLGREVFSRWLRTLCTVSLSRNTVTDRAKAIGYIEQAIAVMKDHSDSGGDDEIYPLDERQWLLATAYNTGTECLHSCLFDEAKRWFEASTVICRFVPGGKEQVVKISETYSTLLSHYQSKS